MKITLQTISCLAYKTIFNEKKTKEIKPQAEKTTSPSAVENFIKSTLSYSQAVSNDVPTSLIAESNAASSNDFNDLKDMMKQLMVQVSNMLNLISTLINKLNV